MALIKCSECDKDVSSTAQKCPHCGAAVKSTYNTVIGLIYLAVLIFAGYLAYTFYQAFK